MPNGFEVGPAKSPGPQPVTITNEDSVPHSYHLQPVLTTYHRGTTLCGPTDTPAPWFHLAASNVTVPAHKTLSVPVSIVGSHPAQDIAVAVTPDNSGSRTSVGVVFTSYAQEVIGSKTTAKACGTSVALPNQSSGTFSPYPILGMGLGSLAVLVLLSVFWRRFVRKSRNSAHAGRSYQAKHKDVFIG